MGKEFKPLVIAEIGINHEGDFLKAKKMIDDAHQSGAECVKFQYHITEEEMIKNDVVPGNTTESIWEIISRCSLTEEEEYRLKKYVDELDMIYLSTPFSREAADKLEEFGITVNKNGIPNDPRNFIETSGIRIGTAAETTRGLKEKNFKKIANKICNLLGD